MDFFSITGGRRLSGKIRAESAKNAILPMMACAVLTKEKVIIRNCPYIKDVLSMKEILEYMGAKVFFSGDGVIIDASDLKRFEVPSFLSKKLRSSIYMLGSVLAVNDKLKISFPGGCDIGARAFDIHLDGLKKLGVDVIEEEGCILCRREKIKGSEITLKYPSVGATENLIICSTLCEGSTVIKNCAKEPEITDLIRFLKKMGAKIYGEGTGVIRIEGVKKLNGVEYTPIGDRIEAGTYILASLISGGEIEISNVLPQNICSLLNYFCNNTCKIRISNDIIYIKKEESFSGLYVSTGPYPDFPTDLQPVITAFCTVADGKSVIRENVFENRFLYAYELKKMGANIKIDNNVAYVSGEKKLYGANLYAKDLRGGAALIVASLTAEGESKIFGTEYIDRGYYNLTEKLSLLGADVKRNYEN
ncbi:MAG: UDP-N-acetylglucosamine 1-carboxyvinyltransferase [Clostridia bacterium]|nr:UDP-N-acetylglucosamine 1-carboxyvinyltransferase [Clostridia bacterium]